MADASKGTSHTTEEWMGLNPAARELGTSRYKLTGWLIAGDLKGKVEAGRQLVTRESVLALKKKLRRSA